MPREPPPDSGVSTSHHNRRHRHRQQQQQQQQYHQQMYPEDPAVSKSNSPTTNTMVTTTTSATTTTTPVGSGLDLSVIDGAFGDYADLYSDVLRVSVVATPEQIQLAYFDRRSELFTLLAKMDACPQEDATLQQRLEAERKMDSVVLAVRILGDPEPRLQYDRIRQERLMNRRRAQHGQLPGHTARVGAGLDATHDPQEDEEGEEMYSKPVLVKQQQQQQQKEKEKKERKSIFGVGSGKKDKKKKKKLREQQELLEKQQQQQEQAQAQLEKKKQQQVLRTVEPDILLNSTTQDTETLMTDDDDDTRMDAGSMDTDEMRQDDGDATLDYSITSNDHTTQKSSYLSCITDSRILRKISNEISYACEDTLVSVDQVFNAFTLTDKDIRAVTKRIDKAKQQLDG